MPTDHQASRQSAGSANTSAADDAMPIPTPPRPHPACRGATSSRPFTATTNASALPRPAIVRSANHIGTVVVSAMAGRLTVITVNEVSKTVREWASRGSTVAATAPARYPV